MAKEGFVRPDEAALRRVLEEARGTTAEVILRLAWRPALRREEIRALAWSDVDLEGRELHLPARRVPLDEETGACLRARLAARGTQAEYVVTSGRGGQMAPSSLSRLARRALDAGGLTAIRLEDLRQDGIIRLLAERGVSHAARVGGVTPHTLYTNYSSYLPKERTEKTAAETDEVAVWTVLRREGSSPAGLALRLVWQLGLQVKEALALTWARVDLERGLLRLPDRQVAVDGATLRLLRQAWESRAPGTAPQVLLSPRTGKPYDAPRLSRAVKTALLRGGVEGVTLETLCRTRRWKDGDERLLRRAEAHGGLTGSDAVTLLPASAGQAYGRLRRLRRQGRLVKIGSRYYPAAAVSPPEAHYETVRAYLEELGSAYRRDLTELLALEPRQSAWVIHGLVERGLLIRDGQRYRLPREKK